MTNFVPSTYNKSQNNKSIFNEYIPTPERSLPYLRHQHGRAFQLLRHACHLHSVPHPALLFDKEHAASIYGSYTGLVYLTPLIGGYIADKYWGIRRSVFWGAMMMAVGQFLMFASASMLEARELSHWLMYGGLTFLILGNGCFKPTVSSLVGQLYEPGDKRLDSAYTIFYMGVNVGSFLAPLVCGYFGETGNPHDFRWGFLIAAIVTVLTVVLFETQKNKYLIGPDGKPLGIIPDAARSGPRQTTPPGRVPTPTDGPCATTCCSPCLPSRLPVSSTGVSGAIG